MGHLTRHANGGRRRKVEIEIIKKIAGDSFSLIEEIAIERHKTKNK